MKSLIRALMAAAALAAVAVPTSSATAQRKSQRGQPKTPFGPNDFSKLRSIEGTWKATAPGEKTYYERYHFTSDSTIEITYYSDSAFSKETGTGRVYLSVGRVYHTFGPGRWGATSVDSSGVYFVPQDNAQNAYAWKFESPDSWTATMRSGFSGRERVTVYTLDRVKSPNGG
jgi:hypothetical protein